LILSISWLMPLFNNDPVSAARALHLALILCVTTAYLIWVERQYGHTAAFFTALFSIAWSNFFGYWAVSYHDLALSPFFLATFFLVANEDQKKSIWTSILLGLIAGVAFLIKQQGILLGLFFALWLGFGLVRKNYSIRHGLLLAVIFLAGMVLPSLSYLIIYLLQVHSIQELVFWTFLSLFQVRYSILGFLAPNSNQILYISRITFMLLPFAVATFLSLKENKRERVMRIWLLLFFLVALSFQYPRYSTRHWTVLFPFAAIISGIACVDVIQLIRKKGPYLSMAVLLLFPAWWAYKAGRDYISNWNRSDPPAMSEYSDLFNLAKKLREQIPSEGEIVIFPNDESIANLYFILKRQPPHFFTFNYPWFMENDHIRERWVDTLEQERPPIALFLPGRWNPEIYAPELVDYLYRNYRVNRTIAWNGTPVQIMLRKSDSSGFIP
jgi:hypothetical protein